MPFRCRALLVLLLFALVPLFGCSESDESGDFGITDNTGQETSDDVGVADDTGSEDAGFHDDTGTVDPDPTPDPDTGTEPEPTPSPDTGTEPEPTPGPDTGTEPEPEPNPVVHDFYASGPYSVVQQSITDSPSDLLVFLPQGDGEYPLVVFQHGFVMYNHYYSQLLEHIASHGFVVAAPQMYDTNGLPFGTPSTAEEVAAATALYDWLSEELNGRLTIDVDVSRMALIGHSRGAKVIYTSLRDTPRGVEAVIGLDPVDGSGGPLSPEPRILDDPPQLDAPTLIIGAGLGSQSANAFSPACAPEGDNYKEFFAAATAPAWQIVAPDYGHMDMLDDNPSGCGLACDACTDGPAREPFRTLSGGLSAALLTATLGGEEQAFEVLSDEEAAPVDVAIDIK